MYSFKTGLTVAAHHQIALLIQDQVKSLFMVISHKNRSQISIRALKHCQDTSPDEKNWTEIY